MFYPSILIFTLAFSSICKYFLSLRGFYFSLLILFLVFSMNSCGGDDRSRISSASLNEQFELCLWNRSQFELHHLFVHGPYQSYQETDSELNSTMAIDGKWKKAISGGNRNITVTRQKNQESQLFAYTTADPININKAVLIEYFDEFFRSSELSEECSDISADSI